MKIRTSATAQRFAKWLSGKSITPNSISMLSLVAASLAAMCFVALPYQESVGGFILPLCAGLFIQLRLLCNLFDGMVAVEGNKGSASGELFNDIPDRFADGIILIGAGYAIELYDQAFLLGWVAALLAVMTAYVRTLSASLGAPISFRGPMAKPQRMAVLTVAAALTAIESLFSLPSYCLFGALVIIVLGSAFTIYNRITATYGYLEKYANKNNANAETNDV